MRLFIAQFLLLSAVSDDVALALGNAPIPTPTISKPISVGTPQIMETMITQSFGPVEYTAKPTTLSPTEQPTSSKEPSEVPSEVPSSMPSYSCPTLEDICVDRGASVIDGIDDAIKELEDIIASPSSPPEAKDAANDFICSLQTAKSQLQRAITFLCDNLNPPGDVAAIIENCARDGDFDTTDLKLAHFAAQSALLIAEEAFNAASAGSIFSAPAIVTLAATVATAQLAVNTLEYQIKEKDDALDACNLSVSDESYAFAQFLACPYTDAQQANTVFIGQGCDGMDNDCDSDIDASGTIKSVDECDEDQVPPSIDLKNGEIPSFKTFDEAATWFTENVETSDDCVPEDRLVVDIGDPEPVPGTNDPRLHQITVTVRNPACNEGAFRTVEVFEFIIDNSGPGIECGFEKRQDLYHVLDPEFAPDCLAVPPFPSGTFEDPLHISDKVSLVDVKFWYQITETENPEDTVIPVNITILSNEYEHRGRDMAEIVRQRNIGLREYDCPEGIDHVHRARVFLAPYTCHDGRDDALLCEVEYSEDENIEITTRFYDIEVTAADEFGNVGKANCHVIVIPSGHKSYGGKSGKGGCSSKSGKPRMNSNDNVNPVLPTPVTEHAQNPAKASSKPTPVVEKHQNRHLQEKTGSKSSKGIEHDPNDLRDEFIISTQRFQITRMELEWDTSLNAVRGPITTRSPNSSKSRKTSKKSSSGVDGPIRRKLRNL